MSAREYWTDMQLVRDVVYNRVRQKWHADNAVLLMHGRDRHHAATQANAHSMRALASERVLVDRVEKILRRKST